MRLEPHIPTRMDRFCRAVQRLGQRVGPAPKATSLEDAIRSAGPRLRKSDKPFGLSHSFLKSSGLTLPLLDLPPGAVELSLRDWVKSGKKAWITIDDFLGTGDWNSIVRPHWKPRILREARQLKEAQLRYQQISAYRRLRKLAESGEPVTRQLVTLNSTKRINAYFERFVALYRSIERDGIWRTPSPSDRHMSLAITADGHFARIKGGQHRLAIALPLGIPTVPMELRMIHLDAWDAAGSVDDCLKMAIANLSKIQESKSLPTG